MAYLLFVNHRDKLAFFPLSFSLLLPSSTTSAIHTSLSITIYPEHAHIFSLFILTLAQIIIENHLGHEAAFLAFSWLSCYSHIFLFISTFKAYIYYIFYYECILIHCNGQLYIYICNQIKLSIAMD